MENHPHGNVVPGLAREVSACGAELERTSRQEGRDWGGIAIEAVGAAALVTLFAVAVWALVVLVSATAQHGDQTREANRCTLGVVIRAGNVREHNVLELARRTHEQRVRERLVQPSDTLQRVVSDRTPHVHEATMLLESGVDPAAVGAAVTIELCGAVEHEGSCRWPHNNDIEPDGAASTFRTLFVAEQSEVDEVHERISTALRSSEEWSVTAEGPRPLGPDEELLAARLANTPMQGQAPQSRPMLVTAFIISSVE